MASIDKIKAAGFSPIMKPTLVIMAAGIGSRTEGLNRLTREGAFKKAGTGAPGA